MQIYVPVRDQLTKLDDQNGAIHKVLLDCRTQKAHLPRKFKRIGSSNG